MSIISKSFWTPFSVFFENFSTETLHPARLHPPDPPPGGNARKQISNTHSAHNSNITIMFTQDRQRAADRGGEVCFNSKVKIHKINNTNSCYFMRFCSCIKHRFVYNNSRVHEYVSIWEVLNSDNFYMDDRTDDRCGDWGSLDGKIRFVNIPLFFRRPFPRRHGHTTQKTNGGY